MMWNPNILNWPSYIHARLGAGMSKIIKDRAEKNQLPPEFKKYENVKAKNLPTIRSIAMSREGWTIVEADYATAEMRGLAFISEDEELLHLLLDPDENFGIPKKECIPAGVDAEDCKVRLKFPDYIKYPDDKEKFVMTFSTDGEIKAKFTEDQLQRNEDGTLKHPAQDLHWQVSELARSVARECLNKKKDRGAAKVVNFCLAKDTQVLTKTGYKPIQNITESERIWDGNNWVKHGGVVSRGPKVVIALWNKKLWCTPDHIVYTNHGPQLAHSAFKSSWLKPVRVNYDRKNKYIKPVDPSLNYTVTTELIQDQHLMRTMYEISDTWQEALAEQMNRPESLRDIAIMETYDILDAGPNNRFTANGILVHNSSSYGGTAGSIARKIEADTGIKPTEEEAQMLLDAVEARQPRATEFFHEMERVPEESGLLIAKSGRRRHCHVLARDSGIGYRERHSQISALGRECRNFFLQESVGASASRACVGLVDFHLTMKEKYGLQGYPFVCLYDSVVIHCPYEERAIWGKALELFMYRSVGWRYGKRILNYACDFEFNAGWSTAPSQEQKALLSNPEWYPTPDRFKPVEDWLDAMLNLYTEHPSLSVYSKYDND